MNRFNQQWDESSQKWNIPRHEQVSYRGQYNAVSYRGQYNAVIHHPLFNGSCSISGLLSNDTVWVNHNDAIDHVHNNNSYSCMCLKLDVSVQVPKFPVIALNVVYSTHNWQSSLFYSKLFQIYISSTKFLHTHVPVYSTHWDTTVWHCKRARKKSKKKSFCRFNGLCFISRGRHCAADTLLRKIRRDRISP